MSNKDAHNKEPEKAQPEEQKTPENEAVFAPIAETELDLLRKEAADYKDKYLRLLADGENARKRMQKEKQELIQFALQNLICEFLHPLDHLENALKSTEGMSSEVKHWAIGFQMILAQFKDVLTNNGVTPIHSKGKLFDPNIEEAVETVETDAFLPETVVEEFIRGYKMGDRVIRPARVKVAKPPLLQSYNNNEQ